MIRCPSCEEVFACEALDAAKNSKLQSMVDKHVKQLQKESSQHQLPSDPSTAINLDAPRPTPYPLNTATNPAQPQVPTNPTPGTQQPQTIQIPHPNQPRSIHPSAHQQTIHIPQPMIARTAVRPTVILQQSPPIIPPNQPTVQAIDTSRFEAPKASAYITGDMSVECIHCRERGHKFKDCPKRAQEAVSTVPMEKPPLEAASGSSSSSGSDSESQAIHLSPDLIAAEIKKGDIKKEQKLTDLEPLRIPKKTANDNKPNSANTNKTRTTAPNQGHRNQNTSIVNRNVKSPPMQHRVTPQVQLINNSMNTVNSLNQLNAINNLNMMNQLNARNRLMNNVLMNAAIHNATRRGGIAPRLINSNPLLNPLLNSLVFPQFFVRNVPISPPYFLLFKQTPIQ